MLKSKIAMALAAAMVMAALYGCSSGVSDSTHNQVVSQVTDLEMQLEGLRDQVSMLEGRADVTPDEVQALRDMIMALEGRPTQADVDALQEQINALQRDNTPADLKTEYLHEQAVVAAINAMDSARPLDDADDATDPFSTVSVAFDLEVKAGNLEAAGDAPDADLSVQAMLSKVDEDEDNDTTTTRKAFVYSDRGAPGPEEWTDYYNTADKAVDGGTDNAPVWRLLPASRGLMTRVRTRAPRRI